MMTEDEAKTKWCPFARAPQWIVADEDRRTPISACNMGVDGERGGVAVSCIGSACMAWRVQSKTELRHKGDGSRVEVGRVYLRDAVDEVTVEMGGFCGLAGAPR